MLIPFDHSLTLSQTYIHYNKDWDTALINSISGLFARVADLYPLQQGLRCFKALELQKILGATTRDERSLRERWCKKPTKNRGAVSGRCRLSESHENSFSNGRAWGSSTTVKGDVPIDWVQWKLAEREAVRRQSKAMCRIKISNESVAERETSRLKSKRSVPAG